MPDENQLEPYGDPGASLPFSRDSDDELNVKAAKSKKEKVQYCIPKSGVPNFHK